ncbi:MAG: UDP-N-acetylglucosamine 1-carboxyvinyltransferase [Polyangiaceae bacterium]
MDAIRIRGGKKLNGKITISGAKNAALPILCATLLSDGESLLRNVPKLRDIDTTAALLRFLGCSVDNAAPRVKVAPGSNVRPEAPYELVKQMRASIMVLGPLLARHGRAKVSLPGGCQIGSRPVDQHLKGLERLGATIKLERGYIVASAPNRLRGAEIVFDMPTVTGTENLMMAAALAKGRTTLVNAAKEPEVEELGRILNKMGATVNGAGTDVIQIEGRDELAPFDHAIIADRIEAGTYMVAVAAAGGDVLLENAPLEDMQSTVDVLKRAGVEISREGECTRVVRTGTIKPVDVVTAPHPGFPTDMQAQLMVLLLQAQGTSTLVETIFENRFMHVPELGRMGAHIETDGNRAVIPGGLPLQGAKVMATDLRASASLVIAGLFAQDETEVLRVYHLDRGYDRMEEKLAAVGADTVRVPGSA